MITRDILNRRRRLKALAQRRNLRGLFQGLLVASVPLVALGADPYSRDPITIPIEESLAPEVLEAWWAEGIPSEECADMCRSALRARGESTSDVTASCNLVAQDAGPALICNYSSPYDPSTYDDQACGRRPPGLGGLAALEGHPIGVWFAVAAFQEAAAVHAFSILHDELRAHGAPEHLRRAALQAALEEVEHARLTAALAHRFGVEPPQPELETPDVRDLEAIAIENAREGCVRETYGAMLGGWQAVHAPDEAFRDAFAVIARDETGHAELSWAIDDWLQGRLDPAARARVVEARAESVANLMREDAAAIHPDVYPTEGLAEALGFPTPEQDMALRRELRETLWA